MNINRKIGALGGILLSGLVLGQYIENKIDGQKESKRIEAQNSKLRASYMPINNKTISLNVSENDKFTFEADGLNARKTAQLFAYHPKEGDQLEQIAQAFNQADNNFGYLFPFVTTDNLVAYGGQELR